MWLRSNQVGSPLPRKITEAARRYLDNHARVGGLIAILADAWEPVRDANAEISSLVPSAKPGDIVDHRLDVILARAKELTAANEFAFEWYLVMAVTFCEAYLEDALASAASLDEKLMERSKQLASYDEVVLASSTTELADHLRRRWARNFLEDSGPRRWIVRLTKMGASGFPDTLADNLERLWGIRHVVVHAAGRTTAEFARRHPSLGYRVGDALKLDNKTTLAYMGQVSTLVYAVDAYLCGRFPTLAVEVLEGG